MRAAQSAPRAKLPRLYGGKRSFRRPGAAVSKDGFAGGWVLLCAGAFLIG